MSDQESGADTDAMPRGKRGVSRGLTRDIILDATKVVSSQRGIENVRILDVARICGVQPSAIYNFFDGREALLTAFADRTAREVILYGDPDPALDPIEKLRFIINNVTRIMYTEEMNARMELMDLANKGLLDRGKSRELNDYSRSRLARVIAEGVAAGTFRAVNLDTLRAFLVAGVAARVLWHNYDTGAKRLPLQDLQEEVFDLVISYIGAR